MCRLIPNDLHCKITDLRVAEHPRKRLGVRSRGYQVPQCFLVILVVGHDESLPLPAHRAPSPVVCLLTNNSISRC